MFSLACYDVLSACGRILIAYADHVRFVSHCVRSVTLLVRFVALFEDDWIRQSLIMYDLSHIVHVLSQFLYVLAQVFKEQFTRIQQNFMN